MNRGTLTRGLLISLLIGTGPAPARANLDSDLDAINVVLVQLKSALPATPKAGQMITPQLQAAALQYQVAKQTYDTLAAMIAGHPKLPVIKQNFDAVKALITNDLAITAAAVPGLKAKVDAAMATARAAPAAPPAGSDSSPPPGHSSGNPGLIPSGPPTGGMTSGGGNGPAANPGPGGNPGAGPGAGASTGRNRLPRPGPEEARQISGFLGEFFSSGADANSRLVTHILRHELQERGGVSGFQTYFRGLSPDRRAAYAKRFHAKLK